MNNLKRPGGELVSRPLRFFWIVDCSLSMSGTKIGTVNSAIAEIIPEMRREAEDNPNAQVFVRALQFSTGASWITPDFVPIDDYTWSDLSTGGETTDMGAAFSLVAAQLFMPPMPERSLPPVLVLLTDGLPTDEYKAPLKNLLELPWGKKAIKVAIAIGDDADKKVLREFVGNPEAVLEANNAATLVRMIKWASTLVKQASAPKNHDSDDRSGNGNASPIVIDPANYADPDDSSGGVF